MPRNPRPITDTLHGDGRHTTNEWPPEADFTRGLIEQADPSLLTFDGTTVTIRFANGTAKYDIVNVGNQDPNTITTNLVDSTIRPITPCAEDTTCLACRSEASE